MRGHLPYISPISPQDYFKKCVGDKSWRVRVACAEAIAEVGEGVGLGLGLGFRLGVGRTRARTRALTRTLTLTLTLALTRWARGACETRRRSPRSRRSLTRTRTLTPTLTLILTLTLPLPLPQVKEIYGMLQRDHEAEVRSRADLAQISRRSP